MKSLRENWTKWINFGDIYEYYGLLDFTNTTSRKELITFNGQNGRPFQDNGFRLRSKEYNYGYFKNKNIDYITNSEETNILEETFPGNYWIRVFSDDKIFNYIGKSKSTIHERLLHHFIKIAGTCEYAGGRYNKDAKKFIDMRDYFKNQNIDTSEPSFFYERVKICFITFKKSKTIIEKVHKVEGLALQLYKNKFGNFPELNSTDETKGLEGIPISKKSTE